jgi:hypothetical protein
MSSTVSKTIHYFTRFAGSDISFISGPELVSSLSLILFQALKEAFEVVCNKTVAGCSSAELFAAYCDSILKKGGCEKLSDEAIEENLDKAWLLKYYLNPQQLASCFLNF